MQDIFSGSTHLSDSSTLILERVDRHHAGVYQCAADNGVREPVSMDINLTILCEFCSMTVDKFPLNCHIPICVCAFFFSSRLFVCFLILRFCFSSTMHTTRDWLLLYLSAFFHVCPIRLFVLLLVPVSLFLSFVNGVFCVQWTCFDFFLLNARCEH